MVKSCNFELDPSSSENSLSLVTSSSSTSLEKPTLLIAAVTSASSSAFKKVDFTDSWTRRACRTQCSWNFGVLLTASRILPTAESLSRTLAIRWRNFLMWDFSAHGDGILRGPCMGSFGGLAWAPSGTLHGVIRGPCMGSLGDLAWGSMGAFGPRWDPMEPNGIMRGPCARAICRLLLLCHRPYSKKKQDPMQTSWNQK